DIIASGSVPVVRLTRIFRQAQGSRIIMNAHRINHGEMPDLRGGKNSDFFFASEETNEDTAAALVKYCTQNLPRYYHADALRDIQVLTPMQRGICGAANLNQLLQEALNPSGIYLRRGGTQYRLRDKVMQIRNDYDKEVFNGDIGIIVRVDTEDTELTVDFDGREVVYDVTELDELVLAYATTIHKAQGSEYPIVVMPFTMSHYVMLQRNLLYTGVTRAKKILVLIGEKKAVAYAVRNETTTARNTKLAERLQEMSAVSNPNGGVPSGNANNTRGKSGVVYRMSEQEREQLKVAEPEITYGANLFARLAQLQNLPPAASYACLGKSKFRSSFSLNSNDRVYVKEKGMDTIRSHARDFVQKRLAPAVIPNDGKQTPMKGHPVFIAQHATVTCCRGCLEKWHKIPKGCELSEKQQEYVVDVLMEWIERQMNG
ncbi:MAG: DUF4186 family protein, partial [Clostridiales bacterium]|nr:DUF4186 family protein [Clostridiales bacterium]